MTAFTSPRTWVASEVVGASTMNTHVRDNFNAVWEQISGAGWTSFTPSYTSLTVGNATNTGYYAYAGKTTFFRVELTLGTTSSLDGSANFLNLPATSVTYLAYSPISECIYVDANGSVYSGLSVWTSTTASSLWYRSVSGSSIVLAAVTSSAPFTWTSTDKILMCGCYERA